MKKKKKRDNMIMNVTKISQKMEKKQLVGYRKNITKPEKMLYYNHKKVFQFRKFCFFIR